MNENSPPSYGPPPSYESIYPPLSQMKVFQLNPKNSGNIGSSSKRIELHYQTCNNNFTTSSIMENYTEILIRLQLSLMKHELTCRRLTQKDLGQLSTRILENFKQDTKSFKNFPHRTFFVKIEVMKKRFRPSKQGQRDEPYLYVPSNDGNKRSQNLVSSGYYEFLLTSCKSLENKQVDLLDGLYHGQDKYLSIMIGMH